MLSPRFRFLNASPAPSTPYSQSQSNNLKTCYIKCMEILYSRWGIRIIAFYLFLSLILFIVFNPTHLSISFRPRIGLIPVFPVPIIMAIITNGSFNDNLIMPVPGIYDSFYLNIESYVIWLLIHAFILYILVLFIEKFIRIIVQKNKKIVS